MRVIKIFFFQPKYSWILVVFFYIIINELRKSSLVKQGFGHTHELSRVRSTKTIFLRFLDVKTKSENVISFIIIEINVIPTLYLAFNYVKHLQMNSNSRFAGNSYRLVFHGVSVFGVIFSLSQPISLLRCLEFYLLSILMNEVHFKKDIYNTK